MKTRIKYHNFIYIVLAMVLWVSSSTDFILEVGHQLNHLGDYFSGETMIHSHSIASHDSLDHSHELISSIADAIDSSKKNTCVLHSQEFHFDQINLVNPTSSKQDINLTTSPNRFEYLFFIESPIISSSGPPPKYA